MTPANPEPRYQVFVTPTAKRQIASLPKDAQRKIDAQILELAVNPRPPGVKKLKAQRDIRREIDRLDCDGRSPERCLRSLDRFV